MKIQLSLLSNIQHCKSTKLKWLSARPDNLNIGQHEIQTKTQC